MESPEIKRVILVVDDEAEIRGGLRAVLSLEGYEVLTAADGAEGFELALRAEPDLIISDIAMPGLNGLDMCRRLRREPATRRIPILLASSHDPGSDQSPHWDAYLRKPTDVPTLLARIERMLDDDAGG